MGRQVTVTDEELLAVFEHADQVVDAAEIAEHVSLKRRSVLERLHRLADEGKLQKKQIGQSWAWWRPESGSSAGDSWSGPRDVDNLRLPFHNDDPEMETIRNCLYIIKRYGGASKPEIKEQIGLSDETIKYELVEAAFAQLHDDVVAWNEEAERWEAGASSD